MAADHDHEYMVPDMVPGPRNNPVDAGASAMSPTTQERPNEELP